jgi:fatty-acyl-CoA synthase
LRRCEAEFGVEVINCYGQTETCGVTTSTIFSDSEHTKTTTSGRPLEGVSIKIADKDGEPVTRGVPGQLCYKGPGMMSGYQDDEANSEAFDREGWFLTGDLATMDSNNNVIIVGRAREMIIRGGENLSPGEIENYMLEHPDIADVAVVGIPDPKYGEVVCAALRTRSPDHASAEEIHAWCNDRVSRWKVPEYIVFVEQFPTTHSGKIQKHVLREQLATQLGPKHRLS